MTDDRFDIDKRLERLLRYAGGPVVADSAAQALFDADILAVLAYVDHLRKPTKKLAELADILEKNGTSCERQAGGGPKIIEADLSARGQTYRECAALIRGALK